MLVFLSLKDDSLTLGNIDYKAKGIVNITSFFRTSVVQNIYKMINIPSFIAVVQKIPSCSEFKFRRSISTEPLSKVR